MLEAKPYLREISLKPDKILDPARYPFTIPAVKHLGNLQFDPDVTFLIGENGTGKSTLLEAMSVALGFNAEGGGKNFNFSNRDSHSSLHSYLRVVRSFQRPRDSYFLRAESFFNVATEIDRLDAEPSPAPLIIASYGGIPLYEQSHGESFFALMMQRFRGRGLYILDEPEAARSPKTAIGHAPQNAATGWTAFPIHHRHALADPDGVSERQDLPVGPARLCGSEV
jgi:predicted ATPase